VVVRAQAQKKQKKQHGKGDDLVKFSRKDVPLPAAATDHEACYCRVLVLSRPFPSSCTKLTNCNRGCAKTGQQANLSARIVFALSSTA
jgi:hypothetical protein